MECLQYENILVILGNTLNVLNLVINGMPSILNGGLVNTDT